MVACRLRIVRRELEFDEVALAMETRLALGANRIDQPREAAATASALRADQARVFVDFVALAAAQTERARHLDAVFANAERVWEDATKRMISRSSYDNDAARILLDDLRAAADRHAARAAFERRLAELRADTSKFRRFWQRWDARHMPGSESAPPLIEAAMGYENSSSRSEADRPARPPLSSAKMPAASARLPAWSSRILSSTVSCAISRYARTGRV